MFCEGRHERKTQIDLRGHCSAIATDHVRVPSPMIGQYTLDLRVNSIRDTGIWVRSQATRA